ncbi:MAG: hypothetical protein ACXAE3_00435 [Candidatus Kariarchaeaceae archaeon]|jgi:hypothetical protein
MSVPQLSEVCLVANLQTLGPTFLGAAEGNVFDPAAGMLLAARIIITSGMGNSTTGLNSINGPIPISELELDDDYSVFFYPMELQQMPRPDNQFSTGRGTYVICLLVRDSEKTKFRSFERMLELIVSEYTTELDFSNTITGEVPAELKQQFSETLKKIKDEINEFLQVAAEFTGGSLFDIGLLANLPDALSVTGKKLMLNPKGILEGEIDDKPALRILYLAGLVEKEVRDEESWIVPR